MSADWTFHRSFLSYMRQITLITAVVGLYECVDRFLTFVWVVVTLEIYSSRAWTGVIIANVSVNCSSKATYSFLTYYSFFVEFKKREIPRIYFSSLVLYPNFRLFAVWDGTFTVNSPSLTAKIIALFDIKTIYLLVCSSPVRLFVDQIKWGKYYMTE